MSEIPELLERFRRGAELVAVSITGAAACTSATACTFSSSSGDASRVPRHLGYLLHPRNQPFRP
jgi:hypothetical protein